MLVSENWLRQLADPGLDRDALSHKLTMAGLEVDDLTVLPLLSDKIIVAKIVSVRPHTVKEKLKVCSITYGKEKETQVVCGAPNAREDLLTAFAPAGSVLPDGKQIGEATIAGVASYGMLCSEKELGISEDNSGIMELDSRLQPGISVNDAADLPDAVFDIDLTPNRGDCLSMLGVARDLSALTGCALTFAETEAPNVAIEDLVNVDVQAPESCPRYCGRVVKGVNPKASIPEWMKQRLNRGGLRSVGNAVVDVTNYVQLELGQPMHSFDLAKVRGGIKVVLADKETAFEGIDGKSYAIEQGALVIADEENTLAVAGVIGGNDSAVTDATTNILLESAYFTPDSIAGRARKMSLHTESSHRFERGVDPAGQARALNRATELILEICGGAAGPIVEVTSKEFLPTIEKIKINHIQVNKILGSELDAAVIENIFKRLLFQVEKTEAGWTVVPPSWRQDVRLECDVIEEIIRIHGYENIPTHTAHGPIQISVEKEERLPDQRIRDLLCDAGYFEAISYSFIDQQAQQQMDPGTDPVAVTNPIASDMTVMRTSLWPGLLQALGRNVKRQSNTVRLFETGNVFTLREGVYIQQEHIAAVATGEVFNRSWDDSSREMDFFDLKGVVENLLRLGKHNDTEFRHIEHPALHPGQSAEVMVDGDSAGKLGRLHPSIERSRGFPRPVYLFELDASPIKTKPVVKFSALSQFPPVKRDLAIVVAESIDFEAVRKRVLQTSSKLLSMLELFDVYSGNNVDLDRKSLGFSLTFQASSRTLNDTEVDDEMNLIISALQSDFGAEIRK